MESPGLKNQIDPFRQFLLQIHKEITSDELEGMKFLAELPDGVSEKTTSALSFFKELMKRKADIIDCLMQIFSGIGREDLMTKLTNYVEEQKELGQTSPAAKHEFLKQSSSFQNQDLKYNEREVGIPRCHSCQDSIPGQEKHALAAPVCFTSAPSSPPEERAKELTAPVALADERSSSELCTQLHKLLDIQEGNGPSGHIAGARTVEPVQISISTRDSQQQVESQAPFVLTQSISVDDHSSKAAPVARSETVDGTPSSNITETISRNDSNTELKRLISDSSELGPDVSQTASCGDGAQLASALSAADAESCFDDLDKDGPSSCAETRNSSKSIEAAKTVLSGSQKFHAFENAKGGILDAGPFSQNLESSGEQEEPGSSKGGERTVGRGTYRALLERMKSQDSTRPAPEAIILRNYQKELAGPGLRGSNCIICAPTGSGKTLTAGYICQYQRMKAAGDGRPFKALFIVCIRNLIMQQRDALNLIVARDDGKGAVGGIRETTILSEYLRLYDVVVLTAQILVNCLRNNELKMSDFDLLILDECHHTTLKHPYSAIMLEYLRYKKENPAGKLPQIIGLTASLGVGSGTADDSTGTLFHYIRLCANLNCTSITHVRNKENFDELLHFNPKPKKDQIITVEPRSPKSTFSQIMTFMMTEIECVTAFPVATAFFQHGSQQYEQWVIQQRREAEAKGIVETIICTEALQRLNRAAMLYDELRARDAKRYVDLYFAENFSSAGGLGKTSATIRKLYEEMQPEMESVVASERMEDNPKLHCLCRLLTDLYSTNGDARGIILTRTRLSVDILLSCIKELPELGGLVYPRKLVGQGGKDGRMTDVEQENTLRQFRHGRGGCNLLIATDVAQEGLDMPKCNFVIRYNFVSNEIGSVQSKGRARAPNSECYLIVDRNSVNEKREYENLEKEHMMMQALDDVDEVGEERLREQIMIEQQRILAENEVKLEERKLVAHLVDAERVTIHCRYCKSELCSASDMRLRLNNYICVAEELLLTRIYASRLQKPDEYRFDSRIGLLYCNNANCRKVVGSQLKYKQGVRAFGYVLSKQNVMWRYGGEDEYRQIKKWSTVPFRIVEEKMFPVLTAD